MKLKTIGGAAVALALGIGGLAASPAWATNPEPVAVAESYVTVAWVATEGDIWNPPQVLAYTQETATPDLHALDDEVAAHACGVFFQVDVYIDDATTDALIAGGILYGPNNPTEHLVPGGEGTAWKYIKSSVCPPPPGAANAAATVTASCGVADVLLSNDLGTEASRLTASFVVWVDGVFYSAHAVAGGATEAVHLTFGEDTGDHSVVVRTGPAQGDVKLAEATVTSDCILPPKPDDKVVTSDWVDGTYECGDTTVEQTRTVATTVYVLDGRTWVEGETTTVTETQTRDLTPEEVEALDCPVPVPPTTDLPTPELLAYSGQDQALLVAGVLGALALLLLGAAAVVWNHFRPRYRRTTNQ